MESKRSKETTGNLRRKAMRLKVLIHPAEEGGYWVEAPALPGCVSEGETLEEALANIREAAEGWLEVAAERAPPDGQAQVGEIEL
jgi:predicted RNase H-like HicB family nuclease